MMIWKSSWFSWARMIRSTIARPILLQTGFCLSEVAVIKNYLGQKLFRGQERQVTHLVLDVDEMFGVCDGFDIGIRDRMFRFNAH